MSKRVRAGREQWSNVKHEYEKRFEISLEGSLDAVVRTRDAWGWQLDNEEYSENEREYAAFALNVQLEAAIMAIPTYGTTIEDHIREIVARRMDKIIEKYEDMAGGDDPLYTVVADVLDYVYMGLIVA